MNFMSKTHEKDELPWDETLLVSKRIAGRSQRAI
jgi:hypothetical protein